LLSMDTFADGRRPRPFRGTRIFPFPQKPATPRCEGTEAFLRAARAGKKRRAASCRSTMQRGRSYGERDFYARHCCRKKKQRSRGWLWNVFVWDEGGARTGAEAHGPGSSRTKGPKPRHHGSWPLPGLGGAFLEAIRRSFGSGGSPTGPASWSFSPCIQNGRVVRWQASRGPGGQGLLLTNAVPAEKALGLGCHGLYSMCCECKAIAYSVPTHPIMSFALRARAGAGTPAATDVLTPAGGGYEI